MKAKNFVFYLIGALSMTVSLILFIFTPQTKAANAQIGSDSIAASSQNIFQALPDVQISIDEIVASGFEHSIANMYFIPMGIILKGNSNVMNKVLEVAPDANLSRLNITGLLGNLLPVTLGNIVGGAVLVAAIYWLIIVLPKRRKRR